MPSLRHFLSIVYLPIAVLCISNVSAYANADEFLQAVVSNDYSEAQRQLAAGVDINAKDANGKTALQYALDANDTKMAKFLVEHHAAYTIHQVAELGDVRRVTALLHDDPKLVSSLDSSGYTPLHAAAEAGQRDVVKLLIAAGADIGARDNNGRTPLHLSVAHKDIVLILLNHGADINAKSNLGETILLEAAEDGNKRLVELLLARGADVNARDNNGRTPLSAAESALNEECDECDTIGVAKLLRQHGAHK